MSNGLITSTPSMEEQLAQKDIEIIALKQRCLELEEESKACKEFFGYESDMTVQDMKKYKDECEEEEKTMKEADQDYADQCDKSDKLVDLVVELGEYQYAIAEIYGKIKKLSDEQTIGLRKNFTSDFMALKDVISEENMEDFFDLIHEWLDIQKKIHEVDQKISDAKA